VMGGMAGLFSGFFQTFWLTNSLYTPFVVAISAILGGVSFRQKYRGGVYNALRRPSGAAAIVTVSAYLLSTTAAFSDSSNSLAARLDDCLTIWRTDLLTIILPLLFAGLIGEILFIRKMGPWRKSNVLLPSPDEGFSDSKFWRISLPVCLIFVFLFSQAIWSIQTRQLNKILQNSIASHAGLAAGYWAEEELALGARAKEFAKPELMELSPMDFFLTAQKAVNNENLQISIVSQKGLVIHQYPNSEEALKYSAEVLNAVKSGLSGNSTPVLNQHSSEEIQFLTLISIQPIQNGEGRPSGVVLLQEGLSPRPSKSKFWAEVTQIEEAGGVVWVVPTNGSLPTVDEIAPADIQSRVFPGEFLAYGNGNSNARYAYWPSTTDWNIFIKMSSTAVSENLLPEFLKQTLLLVIGFAILLLLLNLYWLNLFRDEQRLLQASRQISRGDYSPLLVMQEISELSDLAKAIEQIRVNVKVQTDEAQRLISIGRGVAFKEEFGSAIEPILNAAIRGDASSARVILMPPQVESVIKSAMRRFGLGERSDVYAVLDNQLLEICKREGIFVIRNTARSRRIDLNSAVTVPSSIVGLPIYLEKDDFLGVFWVGYERPQIFPEEEVSHLKMLASEIAVAAAGERRLTETEHGRKQFEALLGAIHDPLLLLDVSGEVIFANEAASSLDGLILRDEDGKRVAALPSLQKSIPGGFSEFSEEGIIREIQLASGRIFSARFTPFESDGRFGGSLCVLRDVNTYTEMLARKGEFVETVSHDLRQPLAMISGYATMIQMVGAINDQQNSYLQKITNGLETMNKMVNNILDLGRIENDTRLRMEELQAETLVSQVVNELVPQANQKKIVLSDVTQKTDSALVIAADAELLHQALINVVENAIKFTNIDGKVDVWVEKIGNRCVFNIQDNGIGISPIDLPGLFNKSSRNPIRESVQRASKLGLTIVNSIVELHGGKVEVESQLGKGSLFRIEIPI
ncbi:MAG: ATP-binding protein, partial [Leptolinea sp.]